VAGGQGELYGKVGSEDERMSMVDEPWRRRRRERGSGAGVG
jgi:hypothetical protein